MTPLTKDLCQSNEGVDIFTESESQEGNPGPDRVACNEGPLVRPVRWETHWRTKLLWLAVPYPFDRTVPTLSQGHIGAWVQVKTEIIHFMSRRMLPSGSRGGRPT